MGIDLHFLSVNYSPNSKYYCSQGYLWFEIAFSSLNKLYIHLKQIGVSYHCFASSSLSGDWAKAMWTLFNYILIKSLRALLEKLKTLYASLFDSNLSGVFLLTHKSTRCAQPVWAIFQVMKVKKKMLSTIIYLEVPVRTKKTKKLISNMAALAAE